MSEEKIEAAVKRLLEPEIEQLKRRFDHAVRQIEKTPEEFEEIRKNVEERLKNMLRVERSLSERSLCVIDILAKGGIVEVRDVECGSEWQRDALPDVRRTVEEMIGDVMWKYQSLPRGMYRIVLIVEPVEVVK